MRKIVIKLGEPVNFTPMKYVYIDDINTGVGFSLEMVQDMKIHLKAVDIAKELRDMMIQELADYNLSQEELTAFSELFDIK